MLKRRVDALEQSLQTDDDILVVCFVDENDPGPTDAQVEAACRQAVAEGKKNIFWREAEEWAK